MFSVPPSCLILLWCVSGFPFIQGAEGWSTQLHYMCLWLQGDSGHVCPSDGELQNTAKEFWSWVCAGTWMPGVENLRTQYAEELYSLQVHSFRTCKRLTVIKGWNLFPLMISLPPFLVQFYVTPLRLNKSCFSYQAFSWKLQKSFEKWAGFWHHWPALLSFFWLELFEDSFYFPLISWGCPVMLTGKSHWLREHNTKEEQPRIPALTYVQGGITVRNFWRLYSDEPFLKESLCAMGKGCM